MGLLSGLLEDRETTEAVSKPKATGGLLSGLLESRQTTETTDDFTPKIQGIPEFIQFPQFYGVSREELENRPNIDAVALETAPSLFQLNDPNELVKWHQKQEARHKERTFIPNLAIDFVKRTQPDLIAKWQELGPKKFGESFAENPQYKIPFVGSVVQIADDITVLSAMDRLAADDYRSRPDPATQFDDQPQIGGFSAKGFDQAPTTIKQISPADQKSQDEGILGDWLVEKAQNSVRGQTIGGQIGAGVSEMPGFMVEFMATGPGAGIVRQAVKKSVTGLTKKVVGKKLGEFTGKAVGFTAGATARTAQAPQQIAAGATGELLGSTEADFTEKGVTINQSTTPGKALLKATASTFIEMFSEQAGKDIIGRLIPNKVKSTFERAFKSLNPNKSVSKLWTKGGFDGFIEEMGEEELGEIMRVGFGVDSFEDYKQNKTLENYLVKGGIIGTVGGVGKTIAVALPKPKLTIAESEEKLAGSLDRIPVEPILRTGGRINEKATLDALPEIPKDKVRVYRAESPTVGFEEAFGDIKEKLKDFAPDREGSFWTSDLDLAHSFKLKFGDDAEITYTDIPKQDAANFKVNGNAIEFVLSKEIFKKEDQPLEQEVTDDAKIIPDKRTEPKIVEPKEGKKAEPVPEVATEAVGDTKRAEITKETKLWQIPRKQWISVSKTLQDNWDTGFRKKDGSIINTGPIHVLPKGVSDKGVIAGFINTTTGEFLTREQHHNQVSLVERMSGAQERFKKAHGGKGFDSHQIAVEKAINAGENVPVEVLKDYPELVKSTTATPKRPTRQDVKADLKGVTKPPIVSGRPVRPVVKPRPKTIKRIVREQTGQIDISERKQISEKALNKLKLSAEQRGSILGFRAAKGESKEILQLGKNYIQDNLPLSVRGKAGAALKGSIDPKGLEKLITTVDNLKSEFEHREAKEGLVAAIEKVSGKNASKLLPEVRALTEAIVDENILTKPSSKTLKDLEGLARAVEDDPFQDTFNQNFINNTLEKVRNAVKTPIGDLPTQTLIDLTDTINMLIKQNQDINSIRILKKQLEFSRVTGDITKSIDKQKSLEDDAKRDSEKGLFSKQWENTARNKLLVNSIDNSEDGFMTQVFHEEVDVAQEEINRDNHNAKKILMKASDDAGVKWGSKKLQRWSKLDSGKTIVGRKEKADVRDLELVMNPKEGKKFGIHRTTKRKIKLSPAELIYLHLTLRDPSNLQKALDDGLLIEGFEVLGNIIHISNQDVKTIKDALTKEEQVFAEAIFKYFQTESKEKLIEVEAQDGRSIKLEDIYIPRRISKAKVQQFGKDLIDKLGQMLQISSFRKERVKNPNPLVIQDAFQVFLEHADQLNKDLYMRPVAKKMLAILGNPGVSQGITRVYGGGLLRNLQERVFDVMTISSTRFTEIDSLYTKFLRTWSMSKLGLRISTMAKQLGGVFPAASEASNGVYKQYAKQLANPKAFNRAAERMINANATLRDRYEMSAVHLSSGVFQDKRMMLGRKGVFDFTLAPMQHMDKRVAVAIFEDFEEKIKASNPNISKEDLQKQAGRKAEEVVADTQNTTSIANMSKIARDSKRSTFLKSTTLFMSNAESMVNLLRTSAWRISASKLDLKVAKEDLSKAKSQHKATKEINEDIERIKKKIVKDRIKLAETVAAVMLGNAGTAIVINELTKLGRAGVLSAVGDDEKLEEFKDLEKLLLSLPKKLLLENIGNVHLVGKLARVIDQALLGRPWWKSNLLGPLGGFTSDVINSGQLAVNAFKEGIGTPKGKEKSVRSIFKGLEALSAVLGAPVFVISELGRPLIKLSSARSSGGTRRRTRRTRKTRKRRTRR